MTVGAINRATRTGGHRGFHKVKCCPDNDNTPGEIVQVADMRQQPCGERETWSRMATRTGAVWSYPGNKRLLARRHFRRPTRIPGRLREELKRRTVFYSIYSIVNWHLPPSCFCDKGFDHGAPCPAVPLPHNEMNRWVKAQRFISERGGGWLARVAWGRGALGSRGKYVHGRTQVLLCQVDTEF